MSNSPVHPIKTLITVKGLFIPTVTFCLLGAKILIATKTIPLFYNCFS